MLRKFSTLFLAAIILTMASSASLFAQSVAKDNQADAQVANAELAEISSPSSTSGQRRAEIMDALDKQMIAQMYAREKNNLAAYERSKAAGKRFSNTTKVLIGVGIAAAVVGAVVFAASRDKIKTF